MAENITPHNWLNPSFYTTPKFAHQIMTLRQWKETLLATNGSIISNGETWKLTQEYLGGGMREVRAKLPYWEHGKPRRGVKTNGS